MSKIITRKYIQRITKREGDTSIRRNGGGGGGGGGVSQYWVDDNYVSKEFFNRLFEIHDENGEAILPNDVETEIDNIQAMFGFWTNAYLSALGQNEGGGGAELTLASLADVAVQGVTDGQALVWNAAHGKWVPGQGGGGSAEELTNKTVTPSTIDGLSGSFTFEGGNLISSATDYVGMQIGSSVDKIQIAGQAGSLMIRQNDNGGTSASGWTDWTMMLTANNYSSYITGYLPLAGGTMTGTIYRKMSRDTTNAEDAIVYVNTSGTPIATMEYHNTAQRLIFNAIGSTSVWSDSVGKYSFIVGNNELKYNTYDVWYAGNDGAGSGLDADLLDGHHAADFALASAITDMATQTWVSTNYLTKTDANNTYLSISFFRALFRAYTSGGSEVVPNGGNTSTIDNIKAMFGFWTNSYLSALGSNPGGASLTLSSLSDVSISGATAGQVLTYRNGTWRNETPQGGGTDMQTVWQELATTGTQQINKTHLTTALADYLPLTGGTMTGTIYRKMSHDTSNAEDAIVYVNTSGTPIATMEYYNTAQRLIFNAIGSSNVWSDSVGKYSFIVGNNELKYNTYDVWYAGNDGAGSGLDADLLDGRHATDFAYGTDGIANSASALANKSVTASTLDGLAGSFTFEGNNLTTSGYDEVGIQVGSSVDKFQIIGKSGTLLVRQNDNGGTSTSDWTAWTMLPTKVFTSNQLTKTDQWYRVANLTTYGLSYVVSIRDNYYHREPTPATFIINTSYTNATITQIGRASTTPTDITKLRVVKYGNGTFHVEVYTPKLSGSSSASMNTPEVNIFNLGRENTSDGIALVHDPNDDTKWLEVDKNIASGETLIEEADISTGTMIAGDMLLNNAQYIGWKNKAGTAQRICIGLNSDNDFLVGFTTAGSGYNTYLDGNSVQIRYGTSRNTGIYLNSSGNVGIGTTSPSYKLHVEGTGYYSGNLLVQSIDIGNTNEINATGSNKLWLQYRNSGALVLCHNGANCGVGVDNPAYKLDVNGDVQATNFRGNFVGNADSATKLKTARTIWGQSFDGTANVSGSITNATTITASSNVSVGGTLSVTGTSTLTGHVGIGTSPHNTYVLRAAGEVYVSTGLYSHGYVTALSDIRHKDIQGDVGLTVSEVANAPAVKFLWKDRRQEGLQVGSIAQYWQKVLPEAIVEAADGELTMSYGVIALLAAIANAREIVNLKREIAELKRKLSNHGILE